MFKIIALAVVFAVAVSGASAAEKVKVKKKPAASQKQKRPMAKKQSPKRQSVARTPPPQRITAAPVPAHKAPICPLEPCMGTFLVSSTKIVYKVGGSHERYGPNFARAANMMAREKFTLIPRGDPRWESVNVTYIAQTSKR